MQIYALTVGTLYFLIFWGIDHIASHFMARCLANPTRLPLFPVNILSLLRRLLLLCTTTGLMMLDYIHLILGLPFSLQQLPIEFWAVPIVIWVLFIWLWLETWILGRLFSPNQSPSLLDYLRLSAHSKQALIGTPDYGTLSSRINRMLYLLAYAHLVILIYEYRVA